MEFSETLLRIKLLLQLLSDRNYLSFLHDMFWELSQELLLRRSHSFLHFEIGECLYVPMFSLLWVEYCLSSVNCIKEGPVWVRLLEVVGEIPIENVRENGLSLLRVVGMEASRCFHGKSISEEHYDHWPGLLESVDPFLLHYFL